MFPGQGDLTARERERHCTVVSDCSAAVGANGGGVEAGLVRGDTRAVQGIHPRGQGLVKCQSPVHSVWIGLVHNVQSREVLPR